MQEHTKKPPKPTMEYFNQHFHALNISLKCQNYFKMRIMSLAGLTAPEKWSKLSLCIEETSTKANRTVNIPYCLKPDTPCPRMLYSSI